MQFERGTNRAQVVVFVRRRHAEERDDLFADRLIDEAAVLPNDVDRHIAQARDQPLRLRRRHAIDERWIVGHDGDSTAARRRSVVDIRSESPAAPGA